MGGYERESYPVAVPTISSTGFIDFHCHLDRAYTHDPRYFQHEGSIDKFTDVPLKHKQSIVGVIHRGSAFTSESLVARMEYVIQQKIAAGERGINAIVDCTTDIGSRSFDVALMLREKYLGQGYEINIGAYPLFGFKERGSDRQKLFQELAPHAQFLMGLPERDDQSDHPVGFDGHVAILIETALETGLPCHVHLDQTGMPEENGTERFVQAVHWLVRERFSGNKLPEMWAVHVISPSSYSEERFDRLARDLYSNDIGVVVCPWAAVSMRQMRNRIAPIHNSLARVRELLKHRIRLRFGTDNLVDLFMPGPPDVRLIREWDCIQGGERWYDNGVLGKLFRGEYLNQSDLVSIDRSIDGDYEAFGWLQKHVTPSNGH